MLDIAPSEFLLVAFVALVVIGPKDLPKAMRLVGHWVGKARGVARQFRSGFDEMVRESELAEMEKKWAEENARIMREHPAQPTQVTETPLIEAPLVEASDNDVRPAEDAPAVTHPVSTEVARPTTAQSALPFDGQAQPVMVEKPVVVPADGAGEPKSPDDTPKAPS